MISSQTLFKDWKRTADEAWVLGKELYRLVRMLADMLGQAGKLSKDLTRLGWEILHLLHDVLHSGDILPWKRTLEGLLRQFIGSSQS